MHYGLAYGETRAELSVLIDRIFSACYLLLSLLAFLVQKYKY
jgi:hypothetical protein